MGRPRGSVNTVNASVREVFRQAFEKLGGVPAMVEWARLNPTEFYKLYGRLIPQAQGNGDGQGGGVILQIVTGVPTPKLIEGSGVVIPPPSNALPGRIDAKPHEPT